MNRARLVTTILSLALLAVPAMGQNEPAGTSHSPNQLNAGLFAALEAYQHAHSPAALQQLRDVAAKRQQLLYALMASDPGAVLASAVPDDVQAGIPAGLRNFIEHRVTLRGQAEVFVEDGPPENAYSRIHYGLTVAGQHFSLNFADEGPANWQHGMSVEISGVQVGDAVALTSETTSAQE